MDPERDGRSESLNYMKKKTSPWQAIKQQRIFAVSSIQITIQEVEKCDTYAP